MPRKKIDFDVVREIALALPDVEESTIHGARSLKVRGKLMTCPAIHRSADPDTLAVRIDFAQRAELIARDPSVYYVTDHYVNYPTVLVRLSRIDQSSLRDLLRMAWRMVSSKPKASRRRTTTDMKIKPSKQAQQSKLKDLKPKKNPKAGRQTPKTDFGSVLGTGVATPPP